MRQTLIAVSTFLGGLYFALEFFLPETVWGIKFSAYHEQISNGFIAMGSVAVGLGIVNLLMVHGNKILYLKKGAWVSGALLFGMVTMAGFTIADWMNKERAIAQTKPLTVVASFVDKVLEDKRTDAETIKLIQSAASSKLDALEEHKNALNEYITRLPESRREMAMSQARDWDAEVVSLKNLLSNLRADTLSEISSAIRALSSHYSSLYAIAIEASLTSGLYKVLYEGLFISLGSAMFALLGFFIAAAAYRAFRVRSFESALMMIAAVAVMLGQIPFGIWLWDGFPGLRQWLLEVPSAGAFRAIKFGAAIAGLAMAIRMWFSIETRSFTRERGK